MKPLETIIIPRENMNDEKVTITELFFENGDKVTKGNSVLTFDSSKADITVECETTGYIKYLCDVYTEIEVGRPAAEIYENPVETLELPSDLIPAGNKINNADPFITTKAKQLISDNHLTLNDFPGSEIINEDIVRSFLKERNAADEEMILLSTAETKTKFKKERIEVSKKREIDFLSSVQSAGLVSDLTVFIDEERIMDTLSAKLKVLKNSVLPVIIFETSRLLKKYPKLNSFYDNGFIYFYDEVNMGVAIEFDYGLKVATIYNSNTKSIFEIENEIIDKTEKYLDQKLIPEELQNSTFTISDLFNENISFFTPLVNKNQSAILAIGAIDKSLHGFNLTLAYDHRVLTGKYAARFLVELKDRILSYKLHGNDRNNKHLTCFICKMNLVEDMDMEGKGLIKIETESGEKLICSRCLMGWR